MTPQAIFDDFDADSVVQKNLLDHLNRNPDFFDTRFCVESTDLAWQQIGFPLIPRVQGRFTTGFRQGSGQSPIAVLTPGSDRRYGDSGPAALNRSIEV